MAFTIGEREWIDDATDLAESLRRELNILIRCDPTIRFSRLTDPLANQ